MGASIFDLIANHNPTGFAQGNEQRAATIENTRAASEQAKAATAGITVKNEIEQQRLKDAELHRGLLLDISNGSLQPDVLTNPMKYAVEAGRRGMSGGGVSDGMRNVAELNAGLLKMDKERLDLTLARNTDVANRLQAVRNADPAQKAGLYQQQIPFLQQNDSSIDWTKVDPADDAHMDALAAAHTAQEKLLQQAKTKQETATSAAQGAKAAADTVEAQQRTAGARRTQAIQDLSAIDPKDTAAVNAWRIKYPDIGPANLNPESISALVRSGVPAEKQPDFDLKTAQAAAMKAFASEDPSKIDALVDSIVPKNDPMNNSTKVLLRSAASRGATMPEVNQILKDAYDQRGRVQVAKETKQNAVTIDMGSYMNPNGEPSETAKAVANYQTPLATAVGRLPAPAREAVMKQVLAINPDFHAEYYNAFNSTEKDATTGKIATSANALNTMMGHLGVLNDASEALSQHNVQKLNQIANWFGVQTGKDAVTTYNTIVHRLGPEVTKAYLAAGGTQGERGTNEEDFDAKLGPAQRKANIGVSALLADSKIKALQDQYSRGTYGKGKQKLISDEAEAARQRLTGQAPAELRGGGAQQYVRYAEGPNGHQIGQKADGGWYDTQTGAKVK